MRTVGHIPESLRAFVRRAIAWLRAGVAPQPGRGTGFWLVTALLGLLLPAPVAVAVVAARLRRTGGGRPTRPPG